MIVVGGWLMVSPGFLGLRGRVDYAGPVTYTWRINYVALSVISLTWPPSPPFPSCSGPMCGSLDPKHKDILRKYSGAVPNQNRSRRHRLWYYSQNGGERNVGAALTSFNQCSHALVETLTVERCAPSNIQAPIARRMLTETGRLMA